MLQIIEANWLIFILALVVAIAVAVWLFARGSRPHRREYRPDVLDEGAERAQRNQALIDSAPAASYDLSPRITPPAPVGTMAGLGEVIAVAANEGAEEAEDMRAAEEARREASSEGEEALHREAPVETPAPAVAAPSVAAAGGDEITRIKGLGPKLRAHLATLDITSLSQIAAMSDADLDELDTKLGAFAGRPRRDNWVEQARLLLGEDTSAYEAKFGKL